MTEPTKLVTRLALTIDSVFETLEIATAQVRNNPASGIAIVIIHPTGQTFTISSAAENNAQLIGGLEILKHRMLSD